MSALALPIIAGIGVATQATGMVVNGIAQADAAERNAALKNAQADELLAREEINQELMREQAFQAEQNFGSAFAMTGKEGGGIGGMLTIHSQLERNLRLSRREAEYKAKILRAGGEIDQQLGSDLQTAGWITGAGTLIGGATNLYQRYGPKDKSGSLPTVKS